ncbi:hypothetical protein VCR4J2_750022 [Vibrio coralliirubri]|nr:hypothetical protein VCR4J2_750022 [Vibrio coralliirubri]
MLNAQNLQKTHIGNMFRSGNIYWYRADVTLSFTQFFIEWIVTTTNLPSRLIRVL